MNNLKEYLEKILKKFLKKKNKQKALAEFRESIQAIDPNNRKIFEIILSHSDQQKSIYWLENFGKGILNQEPDRNLMVIEDISSEFPEEKFVLKMLSQMYQIHQMFDKEFSVQKKVISLDPNDSIAWLRLAILHMFRKEVQEARECAEKAIKLDPDNEEIQEYVNDLRSIDDKFVKNIVTKIKNLDDEEFRAIVSEVGIDGNEKIQEVINRIRSVDDQEAYFPEHWSDDYKEFAKDFLKELDKSLQNREEED